MYKNLNNYEYNLENSFPIMYECGAGVHVIKVEMKNGRNESWIRWNKDKTKGEKSRLVLRSITFVLHTCIILQYMQVHNCSENKLNTSLTCMHECIILITDYRLITTEWNGMT